MTSLRFAGRACQQGIGGDPAFEPDRHPAGWPARRQVAEPVRNRFAGDVLTMDC